MRAKKRWNFSRNLFLETLGCIRKDGFLFFYMLFFDFLFLVSLFVLNIFTRNISGVRLGVFVIFLVIAYYFLIIFIYSFFKLIILNLIKKMIYKDEFKLMKLCKFYGLNLIVFSSIFILFLIFSALIYVVIREEHTAVMVRVLFAIFVILAYPIVNIVHSFFVRNFLIKESIIKGFDFRKINKYISVWVFSALVALVYFSFFGLIGLMLKITVFSSRELISSYNPIYVIVFSVLTLFVFYFILAFNRIWFYLLNNKS